VRPAGTISPELRSSVSMLMPRDANASIVAFHVRPNGAATGVATRGSGVAGALMGWQAATVRDVMSSTAVRIPTPGGERAQSYSLSGGDATNSRVLEGRRIFLLCYSLSVVDMGWFDTHSGAIQALASIIAVLITGALALFTRQYVKLTRDLVKLGESEGQARARRAQEEAAALTQQRAEAIRVLKAKTVSLSRLLDGFAPYGVAHDHQIRTATVWSKSDLEDLIRLGRDAGVNQDSVLAVTEQLTGVLQQIETVRKPSTGAGFNYDARFLDLWSRRMEAAIDAFAKLLKECDRVLAAVST
jgi:hypothetical protein